MSKRPYLTSKEMRPVYERYVASGQTITEFCKQAGINKHTFNYWRQQFMKKEGLELGGRQAKGGTHHTTIGFHQIELRQSKPETSKITLRVGKDVAIDFPESYSPDLLSQLIHQIRC